ncbi:MAG: MaoC family dehydratase [Actinomycetota bacterium]|nr:MaoC family dehydratase [Actinomycetota bacterium]
MLEVNRPSDLLEHVGRELGQSSWILVSQERVDLFAEATEDRQWIHVDRKRAAQGPFGGTIAHGFLTLSLLSALSCELINVTEAAMLINYGLNRVRFPSALPVGRAVCASGRLSSVDAFPGGVQLVVDVEINGERGGKPACAAVWVLRAYGE